MPPLSQIEETLTLALQNTITSFRFSGVEMGLERLMVNLKSKISRSLKMKINKHYDKIEKSESMRVEIRSRKARKLVEQTLKIADSPNTKTFVF
ncbi:hypothetical protein Q3G72_017906 [Acer saccharum]|nr:hypothetical protein Q3G72_017906 [Acer saccharum]